MKTQNGWTMLENTKDSGTWLKCKAGYYVNKKIYEIC